MPDPQKIGKYTILQRIGRGGMGYVFKAHDPILKRDVAIKTMLREVSEDEELRNRFLREAQSAGGLRHPNIVTIYDLGEDTDGCPFIAMEFLTGTDLEHLIKNKTEITVAKKLDIIIQTCYGLGYAHTNGIVHRDIKTANIRLLDNGEAKIMDFGIAKMTASHFTRTGMIMGTPHYMSPEQIRGERVDGRADIFSLGVVLYELLTYRKPFPGDNPTTVLFKIIHENPEPLNDGTFIPPEGLEEIMARALAKKTDERYSTCEEFAEDLLHLFSIVREQEQASSTTAVTGGEKTYGAGRVTPTPYPALRRTGPVPGGSPLPPSGTPFPATKVNPTAQLPVSEERTAMVPGDMQREGQGTPPAQGAGPTSIQPPAQAQPLYTPAAEAPQAGELPNITMTPVPSGARKWILLASSGVMGIALILVAAFGFFHKTKPDVVTNPNIVQPQKPPIEKPVIQEPKIEQGYLILNIQPWAEITEIKDAKGNVVPLPVTSTPCRVQLNTGKYTVTLTNENFQPIVLETEILPNQDTEIRRTMDGFDNEKVVETLGL